MSIATPQAVSDVPLPAGSDLEVVREWALEVMARFGLTGWTFEFTRAKRALGVCRYRRRTIGLSVHLVERNPPEEVRETLLHEIAHAKAGPGVGHGLLWKVWAIRVGARPVRCGAADMPRGRWRAGCPCCGRQFHLHRRPKRMTGWFCRRCGRERGRLTWGLGEAEVT
jgi:predicted SprT family Zn-dependent metalloprotease